MDKWNQLVTRKQVVKGIEEQGKRNLQKKQYHQRDIVEQYGHWCRNSEHDRPWIFKAKKFWMIFTYVLELQEKAPMDKNHQKRGNEEYGGSPILFYILRRIQGERNFHTKRLGKKD